MFIAQLNNCINWILWRYINTNYCYYYFCSCGQVKKQQDLQMRASASTRELHLVKNAVRALKGQLQQLQELLVSKEQEHRSDMVHSSQVRHGPFLAGQTWSIPHRSDMVHSTQVRHGPFHTGQTWSIPHRSDMVHSSHFRHGTFLAGQT